MEQEKKQEAEEDAKRAAAEQATMQQQQLGQRLHNNSASNYLEGCLTASVLLDPLTGLPVPLAAPVTAATVAPVPVTPVHVLATALTVPLTPENLAKLGSATGEDMQMTTSSAAPTRVNTAIMGTSTEGHTETPPPRSVGD
jgi:hypothetical protein